MLKIYPFSYGLVIRQVYDNGSLYEPAILDITSDVLRGRVMEVSFTLIVVFSGWSRSKVLNLTLLLFSGNFAHRRTEFGNGLPDEGVRTSLGPQWLQELGGFGSRDGLIVLAS